jgi:hypothetical protein
VARPTGVHRNARVSSNIVTGVTIMATPPRTSGVSDSAERILNLGRRGRDLLRTEARRMLPGLDRSRPQRRRNSEETSMSAKQPPHEKPDSSEIAETELEKVVGGDGNTTPTVGSQSSGAGAGKITFNPFSITRKVDKSSP